VACIILVFDIVVERVSSSSLLSIIYVIAPWYQTHGGDFLRDCFHRTMFIVIGLMEQFVNRVKLTLQTFLIL
jgi:hypothetical protein